MKRSEFISELCVILGAKPGEVTEHTRLDAYSEWDSMGKMAVLTLIDGSVGMTVPYEILDRFETAGDLIAFVAPKLEP